MGIISRVCLGFVGIALVLFFLGYYHDQTIDSYAYVYAQLMANIVALFVSEPVVSGAQLKTSGFFIYEERAVLVLFISAFSLCVLAFLTMCWHRIQYGITREFAPIASAALASAVTILYVEYQIGVYLHA